MLIVNNDGIPQEFKCTESIKPSPVQQSLYGEKMELYIAVKLCAIPLLGKVTKKPDVLFINEQIFLEIREDAEVPVLFVQATEQTTDNLPPAIILKTHTQHEDDKNEALLHQSCHFELTEPFERIKNALTVLAEREERFR